MKKTHLISRNTKCYFGVYHFNDQSINTSELDSEFYSLYHNIISMTYTKSLMSPSGAWNIRLVPGSENFDYSKLISPGDWVECFLTAGSGLKYKRFVGNVDRVALEESISPDGTLQIIFSISGRDWGKIFEDTSIFFNPFTLSETLPVFLNKMDGIEASPNVLIKNMIKIFLTGADQIPNCSACMNYWLISKGMAADSGVPNESLAPGNPGIPFASLIDTSDLDIPYPGWKYVSMLNTQGNLWSTLKDFSNEIIYTLFCELSEDLSITTNDLVASGFLPQERLDLRENEVFSRPKIFFGARPYTFKSQKQEQIKLKYFLDLPAVDIYPADIISIDVGANDHDRVNFIYLRLRDEKQYAGQGTMASVYAVESSTGRNSASIRRHGMRLYDRTVDYSGLDSGQAFAPEIYAETVGLLAHWYFGNHLIENGTMSIIGNPNVRVGKRLVLHDNPIFPDRQYYIEAYTDSWTYQDTWRQTIELSRGISVKDGVEQYPCMGNDSKFTVTQTIK